PGLEFGHVYAVFGKYLQAGDQLTGAVMRGQEQARLVAPSGLRRTLLVAEHEEAREVEVEVLHALGDDVQAVRVGGPAAGYGPAVRLRAHPLGQHLRRAGRVVRRHGLQAAVPDETLALLERLRVAVDAPDVLEPGTRPDQQVVVDAHHALRHDD